MDFPPPPLCYHHPVFATLGPRGEVSADLCVYGGTASGVVAAVKAASLGLAVILLEPGPKVGGMTTGGLSFTDIGNKAAIGGLAREFYRRVGARYGVPEAWTFEPHVAQEVLEQWLQELGVTVHLRQFLAGVDKEGARLRRLRTEGGLAVKATVFIDATYEGDLLAAAGVSSTVGREDNAVYGERLNGAQIQATHQFDFAVDPFRVPGEPASGLLPGIEPGEVRVGEGDRRIQSYCFRVCMTDAPDRIPFAKPAGYDEGWYELLARYLAAGWRDVFTKFDRLRVRSKTDTNNHGAVSTDFIGQNFAWPQASYAAREKIFQAHVAYQQGLHWFMANSPRVPAEIRDRYALWGLCRDEFTATQGWPHQLYVREARRLVSAYVMTEHECRGARVAEDAVGLAAYTMDSHNCRRFVRDGRVLNEGDVQEHGFPPYPISYRSLVPRRTECDNLIVPVCLAASHVAYGSIRMEPVFMVLGESAAIAAQLAVSESLAVQDVSYDALRAALRRAGQVISWSPAAAVSKEDLHAQEA